MPWFRAVMTSWMYERAKRHISRNTEAYQSFQLDIGPGAYKRAFLTHRNAVTTAVKRVAGAPCITEKEPGAKGECGIATLFQTEAVRAGELGTSRNSMDMLEKLLEDSEIEDQDGEAMKQG